MELSFEPITGQKKLQNAKAQSGENVQKMSKSAQSSKRLIIRWTTQLAIDVLRSKMTVNFCMKNVSAPKIASWNSFINFQVSKFSTLLRLAL